jgi:uncharacterized membrane protein YgcG
VLQVLHMERNGLGLLYRNVFLDLDNLEELYVQENEINFIEEGAFATMKKLRVVNLQKNLLITMSFRDFSGTTSLTSLSLANNLWSCRANFTCALFQFAANSSVVTDLSKMRCYDFDGATLGSTGSGGLGASHGGSSVGGGGGGGGSVGGTANNVMEESVRVNGTPVLSLPLHKCGVDWNLTDLLLNASQPSTRSAHALPAHQLPVLIAVSVACVLVLSSLVLLYINRHLLEVWCFTRFGWRLHKTTPRRHPHRGATGEGGPMVEREEAERPYDAFVSYSSLDEDFVVTELAPRLENGHKRFRLCLHYRDFPVGASIAETIVRSVESSKRVILLVSNNFLNSEWCKFEFQTAHQQVSQQLSLTLTLQ